MPKRHFAVYGIILLSVCIQVQANQNKCVSEQSNIGKEFIFGIFQVHPYYVATSISIASESSGDVWINAPAVGLNKTYAIQNGTRHIAIPTRIIHTTNAAIQNKAVYILSDVDISVQVIVEGSWKEEGFLSLPIRNDSENQFVIATAVPTLSGYPSDFLIAASKHSTNVSIRFSKAMAGALKTVYLEKGDTYLYQSMQDLSGTYIESSAPVSVIAGNTFVGSNTYGSLLIEQIPSKEYFGHQYIVPPLFGRTKYAFNVFAFDNNVSLAIENNSGSFKHTLSKGLPFNQMQINEPVFISSSHPVMVVQYSLNYITDSAGGEFMWIVPGLSNYMTKYNFLVHTRHVTYYYYVSAFHNYICVVTRVEHLHEIYLDSKVLTPLSSVFLNTTSGNFTIVTIPTTRGNHTIESINSSATFGALLYGFHGGERGSEGYGYPLGMKVYATDKDCPKATPQASLPSASYPQYNTNTTRGGPWCFSCSEVSHLYLCNAVTRCKDSEVCSVSTYTTSSGHLKYRTGCMDDKVCSRNVHNSSKTGDCLECCQSDYCNARGCNGQGFPERSKRGPICFDCQHVESAQDCGTITLCHHDQVCRIEELDWGETFTHLNMGCGHSYQCSLTKRSWPVCQSCCGKDFCNTKCTRITGIPVIG